MHIYAHLYAGVKRSEDSQQLITKELYSTSQLITQELIVIAVTQQ
jgi:hypothetical protein